MYVRVLLYALSLVLLTAAQVTPALMRADVEAFVQYPLVKQVRCDTGKGSAFRTGLHTFLSVAHVTDGTNCTIDGTPFSAVKANGQDFSVITTVATKPGRIEINCEGFKPGEWYWATGFAHGAPWQTNIALYATYVKHASGMRTLMGPLTVIPGMSGGLIMDSKGRAVGTVNAYNAFFGLSFSVELKDTSLCR